MINLVRKLKLFAKLKLGKNCKIALILVEILPRGFFNVERNWYIKIENRFWLAKVDLMIF